ncbi:sensor histidine kinase [Kitasatospora sp. NPDC096147]|uniref:sensor histidine kinase n=1 Tax=Kitasatospora sp. NPDC096147 TaxID=3364093 RepID=UPI00380B8814
MIVRWGAGVAVASLVATAVGWWLGGIGESNRLVGTLVVAELGLLLSLVALAVRARRWPAAALAGSAAVLWPTRYVAPEGWRETIGLFGFGLLAGLLVVAVGLYLGALDERRRREVQAARRAQRIELAHDLHDFVAHDVSGMVALAQAGAFVSEGQEELFRRIEEAGQQALASLDRTVHLLRSEDAARRDPQPGLAELPGVVERFAASGPAAVRLELPDGDGPPVSREAGATAHRVVVEALTNVRRHAPAATLVEVAVRPSARGGLEVLVSDDGGGAGPARTGRGIGRGHGPGVGRGPGQVGRGGHGLRGLAGRVEALDGTLEAARTERGWQVRAYLPPTEGEL